MNPVFIRHAEEGQFIAPYELPIDESELPFLYFVKDLFKQWSSSEIPYCTLDLDIKFDALYNLFCDKHFRDNLTDEQLKVKNVAMSIWQKVQPQLPSHDAIVRTRALNGSGLCFSLGQVNLVLQMTEACQRSINNHYENI